MAGIIVPIIDNWVLDVGIGVSAGILSVPCEK
jgi:hypothetical protein